MKLGDKLALRPINELSRTGFRDMAVPAVLKISAQKLKLIEQGI